MAKEGQQLLTPESGWKRIDNTDSNIVYNGTGWVSKTATGYNIYKDTWNYTFETTDSLDIYFNSDKIRLMCLMNYNCMREANVKFTLDNKDIVYKSFYGETGNNQGSWVVYERLNLTNSIHHIHISMSKGKGEGKDVISLDCIDLDENGQLISQTEYNKLTSIYIKENGKYYGISDDNYDTTTQMYKEVTIEDINNYSYYSTIEHLTKEVTIGSETFKPIDKFNNFQIVSKNNISKLIKGRKVKSSMCIANGDIYTKVANNIDKFVLDNSISNSSYVKMAVSFDNGSTWKTYKNNGFSDLSVTIPIKTYEDMSTEEKTNWNTAKETIMTNGFTPTELESIDFNTIENLSTIRFAYVLYQDLITDDCKVNTLSWQFDAKGSFQKMKDNELTTSFSNGIINIAPSENQYMIITNYVYGALSGN